MAITKFMLGAETSTDIISSLSMYRCRCRVRVAHTYIGRWNALTRKICEPWFHVNTAPFIARVIMLPLTDAPARNNTSGVVLPCCLEVRRSPQSQQGGHTALHTMNTTIFAEGTIRRTFSRS